MSLRLAVLVTNTLHNTGYKFSQKINSFGMLAHTEIMNQNWGEMTCAVIILNVAIRGVWY